MKIIAFLIISICFMTACSKKEASDLYDLKIGSRVIQLDILADISKMEQNALKEIMPLWDKLESGDSEWFNYSKSTPWSEYDGKTSPKGATISATETTSSGELRFFKNRDGQSGIENKLTPIAHWPSIQDSDRSTVLESTKNRLQKFEPILGPSSE